MNFHPFTSHRIINIASLHIQSLNILITPILFLKTLWILKFKKILFRHLIHLSKATLSNVPFIANPLLLHALYLRVILIWWLKWRISWLHSFLWIQFRWIRLVTRRSLFPKEIAYVWVHIRIQGLSFKSRYFLAPATIFLWFHFKFTLLARHNTHFMSAIYLKLLRHAWEDIIRLVLSLRWLICIFNCIEVINVWWKSILSDLLLRLRLRLLSAVTIILKLSLLLVFLLLGLILTKKLRNVVFKSCFSFFLVAIYFLI